MSLYKQDNAKISRREFLRKTWHFTGMALAPCVPDFLYHRLEDDGRFIIGFGNYFFNRGFHANKSMPYVVDIEVDNSESYTNEVRGKLGDRGVFIWHSEPVRKLFRNKGIVSALIDGSLLRYYDGGSSYNELKRHLGLEDNRVWLNHAQTENIHYFLQNREARGSRYRCSEDDGMYFFGGYRTNAGIERDLQNWASRPEYQNVLQLHEMGRTVNERTMYAARLTDRNYPGGKPMLIVDGMTHPMEIAGPEMCMLIIEKLLSGYDPDNDNYINRLLRGSDIWIMPNLNPDGHFLVTEYGTRQKKNANGYGAVCEGVSGSQIGVNINRNYLLFLLNLITNKCSPEWQGPEAMSENETINHVNFINSVFPPIEGHNPMDPVAQAVYAIALSLHTYGKTVLPPWLHTFDDPPNPELISMARDLAGAAGYAANWKTYSAGRTATDHFYGINGLPWMTIEAFLWHFVPYSDLARGFNDDIWPMVVKALEISHNGTYAHYNDEIITPTSSPTATSTKSPTPTPSPSSTPTGTATATSSPTSSPTPTATATATPEKENMKEVRLPFIMKNWGK